MCAACRSLLTPGARFCHRCGLAVGVAAPVASASLTAPATGAPTPAAGGAVPLPARPSYLPWTIAALAFIAVVAILAGQRFGSAPDSAVAAESQAPLANDGAVRAPDISSLSPRERADRLFDRMMRLASEGKKDSLAFFAPMALSAYESLGPLDADLRYDMGRVAEVSGNVDVAAAQADSILKANPTHLLGLILAGRIAELRGNTKAARDYARRLLTAEPGESSKGLDEYQRHRADIDSAVAQARRS
jgi:tetratricopeptide (TPR) repeat protein